MQNFEKLGTFYLGRSYDLQSGRRGEELILYDSRDLVTHAVCVGMTGSGKTGLCITLLEEAAIDGVPAIVIDPKGDLSNLLLTFPQLRPEDFRPWINEDDARRQGLEPDAYAARQAERWREGLAEWGQDGARIQRLRDAAEFAVYTPGSSAGLPVSILKSFDPPPPAIREDAELFRERIASTATSLLGLLGIDADPLQSREHILISTILAHFWNRGEEVDLPRLIQAIQSPPVTRMGVMELETFFPAGQRFELAMRLNNLAASPGFSRWSEGVPLDVGALLYTPAAKPRIAVFSIAHLSDAERMFFVSLLLNQALGWVRTQSGTSSLRAILYMDEIAGYFPPVANPPSKGPLLTLMKQGRAFGFGVVLATQNPVDLDYKGLANAGTWFIGRLQTERDKARVLDGLQGAAAAAAAQYDRAALEDTLSRLGSRVFLMNNVHEDAPQVMETRWALSYLRGPLTRDQIRQLMEPYRSAVQAASPREREVSAAATRPAAKTASETAPVLPPGVRQAFLPVRAAPAGAALQYRPMLLGSATMRYTDAKLDLDHEESLALLIPFSENNAPDWAAVEPSEITEDDLDGEPATGTTFAAIPPDAGIEKSYAVWRKAFGDFLYRTRVLELLRSPGCGLTSMPAESEREFRLRVAQVAREQRDAAVAELREKYAARLRTLEDRLRRARQAVEVQQEQARQAKMSTVVSVGHAILTAFLGRKAASAGSIGRAGTAVRGMGRSYKEAADVGRAEEDVRSAQAQIAELESRLQAEIDELSRAAASEEPERLKVRPKKTNVSVRSLSLVWSPWAVSGEKAVAAW